MSWLLVAQKVVEQPLYVCVIEWLLNLNVKSKMDNISIFNDIVFTL